MFGYYHLVYHLVYHEWMVDILSVTWFGSLPLVGNQTELSHKDSLCLEASEFIACGATNTNLISDAVY